MDGPQCKCCIQSTTSSSSAIASRWLNFSSNCKQVKGKIASVKISFPRKRRGLGLYQFLGFAKTTVSIYISRTLINSDIISIAWQKFDNSNKIKFEFPILRLFDFFLIEKNDKRIQAQNQCMYLKKITLNFIKIYLVPFKLS